MSETILERVEKTTRAPGWQSRADVWVETWTATIWIGRKVLKTGELVDQNKVKSALKEFVSSGGCVSVTETEFIYTGGSEPGFAVGLIQYPRFPKDVSILEHQAIDLAALLRKVCKQERCSIVMPDYTIMLCDTPEIPSE